MARTKASVGAKVSSGKSSKARCSVAPPPSSTGSAGGSERSSRNHSGGNPVCPRETPKWQRPITNFFITNNNDKDSESTEDKDVSGNSKTKLDILDSDDEEKIVINKSKRYKIVSDDEEEDIPKNSELDESLVLEPLTGENSHTIDEYYQKNNKGKGKGKKTIKDNNNDNKRNMKRDLEEINFGEESEHASKRVKVE